MGFNAAQEQDDREDAAYERWQRVMAQQEEADRKMKTESTNGPKKPRQTNFEHLLFKKQKGR